MKKPLLLFRKVKNDWLLLLFLLLFLFCCLRLFCMGEESAETMAGESVYVPQSLIDTLKKAMED